jgi:sugar lactone lactonase YvrE
MIRRLAVGFGLVGLVCCGAFAQGTKLWTQSRYDEMERGTAEGVAIRSDGRLEVAPANSLLYATSGSYVWSIAADAAGDAFLGRGGTSAGSAVVTRVTPDGKATDIFAGKELAVQALATASDGSIYAATSPDGKVYRLPAAGGSASVVFDPALTAEKPKYLWDLATGSDGTLYVAAGAPAVVYKVPVSGKAQVLFRTSDQHIRCLLMGPKGVLYAGSDGAGVIYRFATMEAGAKPFAVYAAPRREITALAIDAAGSLYASAVGEKGAVSLPNLPVTGGSSVSITFVQPGSSTAASANTVIPDGSEIYRIAADGSPQKLLTLKEDVVYALTFRKGSLLAATGNRGRVYRVDTAMAGRWTDVAHLEAAEGMAFAPGKDGLLIATSNGGKVFRLSDAGSAEATYTSVVFDGQSYADWGRAEVLPAASASFNLYVRSGNVESPQMGWSDWVKATPNQGAVGVPHARYVQWKVTLHGDAAISSIALNYLPKNLAPVVDDVVVQPGARIATVVQQPSTTVQVSFPAAVTNAPAVVFQQEANGPLTAQKDKSAVTVRWAAHDDNGDDLMFAVYWKGEGESNWRLLKDKVSERFLSFDAGLLPDGRYSVKVVASDAPVHTDADTLTSERISSEFVVDTTPPVPGVLTAKLEGGKIHVTFEARDQTSPIAHAEYSVDAGPWQYVEPAGQLSDSLSERYDFRAEIPATNVGAALTDAKEHVLAIRVYDRYENAVTAKAVVR